jgi:hypothetical protein
LGYLLLSISIILFDLLLVAQFALLGLMASLASCASAGASFSLAVGLPLASAGQSESTRYLPQALEVFPAYSTVNFPEVQVPLLSLL